MAHSLNRLTATRVKGLTQPGWYADGGGLYLRVRTAGRKQWIHVFSVNGKRVESSLGSANKMTLAEAREKVRQPATISAADAPTFGDFADEYIENQKGGWKNPKHCQQWENTLKTHAKPLRRMKVGEIDTDDVLAVLRPIWRKTPETASRVRGRIERILDAARAAKHIQSPYENPARWKGHLEHFLASQNSLSRGHHKAMAWEEAPAFWAVLAKRNPSPSVLALRFAILTAARTGEVIGAEWREINFEARTWTVPKERMKMGVEHIVPLSDAALEVLKLLSGAGRPPMAKIFPGYRGGTGLSNMAMLKLLQEDMGRPETVHGFRSTFRDWAGDGTEYQNDVVEMALAHAIANKVEAAYRRGRAVEKRRPLMQDWADYLAG